MARIQDVVNHLNAPFSSPILQAWHNYLVHWMVSEDDWSADILRDFLSVMLINPYWRDRQEAVLRDLQTWTQKLAPADLTGDDEMLFSAPISTWTSDNAELTHFLIKKRWSHIPGQQIRILPLPNQYNLVLIKTGVGLIAETYDRNVLVVGDQCHQALPFGRFRYLTHLSLIPATPHFLRRADGKYMVFKKNLDQIVTHELSTPLWQPENRRFGDWMSLPDLFSELKQIEKHFIRNHTDSVYRSLVQKLDSALKSYQEASPDAYPRLSEILHQGRKLQRQLYPDDSNLKLMFTNLQFLLNDPPDAPQNKLLLANLAFQLQSLTSPTNAAAEL